MVENAIRHTGDFPLFRLTKSKTVCDLSPNTLRDWHARGLPFYRTGKPVFVSKRELEDFIRSGGPQRPYLKNGKAARSAMTKPQTIAA